MKNKLKTGAITSFVFAFFLLAALFISLAGGGAEPPVQAAPGGGKPEILSADILSDQLFMLLTPLVIGFMFYITYLLNALLRNLSRTSVCSDSSASCMHKVKYFP